MTRYQPLLCMCHRKSSKRAAENMPCTILTPLTCPSTSRNHCGSLSVQGKGRSGLWHAGHQDILFSDSFKHGDSCGEQCWTMVPVIHNCLSTRGDWWQLAFIQDLISYKLFSHYLFNLPNLSGIYYFLYDATEKTGLWVAHSFIKYLLRACCVSDTLLGTGDKAGSKAGKVLALMELGF